MSNENERRFNIVQTNLWDAAQWLGFVFLSRPEQEFPMLGLIFKDAMAAREIFKDWKLRYGHGDKYGVIRVSLITGKHPTRGAGYVLQFTTEPTGIERHDYGEAHLGLETRATSSVIALFHPQAGDVEAFRNKLRNNGGRYFLGPVEYKQRADGVADIIPDSDYCFGAGGIIFRNRDEITGSDDMDRAALMA